MPPKNNKSTTTTSENDNKEPPTKKPKMEQPQPPLQDPHHIWIGQADDQLVPLTFGGIAVQLTWEGLKNGMTWNSNKGEEEEEINKLTTALYMAIRTKMERDFLDTTPTRIRDMLCSSHEMSPAEFEGIRRRVYDTVILGKGMSSQSSSQNNQEQSDDETIVTAKAQISDVEKVCP